MAAHDQEKWFDFYTTAMLELKRVAMTGRIEDARTEITARLEILKLHPELHLEEYQAIQDALRNLRVLEREEADLAAEDKRRLLQEAAQKLESLAPRFTRPPQQ